MTNYNLKTLIAGSLLALAGLRPVSAATTNVTFGYYFFTPRTVVINVGDTIDFTNGGTGGEHTITGTNSDTFCGTMSLSSCSHTFNTPGTFGYECILHGHAAAGMTGIVIVQASSSQPSVTLTNPVTGAVFAAPASLKLAATASSATGSITNVSFYGNGVLLGSKATAPFSLVSTPLSPGPYDLTAAATDNTGLSVTSSPPVAVTVVTPVAVSNAFMGIIDGSFLFDFTANPGLSYVVLDSTNLTSWTPISTNTASAASVEVTNGFQAGGLQFYRVELQPNP